MFHPKRPDEKLAPLVAGMLTREEIFARCDIVILAKPTPEDYAFFRQGQILVGWPHIVQQRPMAQVAVDKRLTLVAFESMHVWQRNTAAADRHDFHMHVFHLNNELAGYCAVLHALPLVGCAGAYGSPKRAAVLGFGSAGRGAVHGLRGLGFLDITLFTLRPAWAVVAPILGVKHWQFDRVQPDGDATEVIVTGIHGREGHVLERIPMVQALGHFDVIVNCTLQDPEHPLTFVRYSELHMLRDRAMIIDVSCDKGMGFEFAVPTSFEHPVIHLGAGLKTITYYAVDHTPSYMFDAASECISTALLEYLPCIMGGLEAWKDNVTVARAVDVEHGVIKNQACLAFQRRRAEYPHEPLEVGKKQRENGADNEPGTLPTDQYYGTQGSPPDPWRSLRDNWPADTLSSPPKVLSETLVYDGFLRLKKEELSWAGGQVQPYLTLESKPRAVIVLAFTDANELVLCREYRHPTRAANGDGIVTSLPGGIVDAGESPLQAGARELLEEAGYAAERWKVLGSVFPAPGIFSQAVIVAEAEGARPETQRKGAHDPTELLHCRPVPLGILLDAMMCTVDPGNAHAAQQPEILDSLLCAALWLCVMRGRLRPMMSAGK
eukprot:jgi/Mesvir1/16196/Mv08458-RA.1